MSSQRWQRLIPVAFVTYTFAYLDRSNYSIGAAGGLKHDLGLGAGASSLLGALFFLGYFFFQVPAGHYAEHRSVKKLMFWSLIAWGILAAAQGVVPWVWALMVVRFLLGVVEAAVIPASLVFLAHWFTRAERGRANTFLILGNPITLLWMSALSGWLVDVVGWRWMFILEGLPAIAWAFAFRALVADRPADAAWLDARERAAVEERLAGEREDDAQRSPSTRDYAAALRERNVVVLALQYLCWSVGVYGFVFWLPTIVKGGSGFGITATGLLSAIPYAAAAVVMLADSWASDKTARRRVFIWPPLLLGAVAFYASYLLGPGAFWWSFALMIVAAAAMYAPYGPYFAFVRDCVPDRMAGAATGLVNAFGGLGGFAGAYVVGWLTGSGATGAAFVFMAGSQLVAALLMFAVRRPRRAEGRRGAERGTRFIREPEAARAGVGRGDDV
jgi:sugar phosphate permease